MRNNNNKQQRLTLSCRLRSLSKIRTIGRAALFVLAVFLLLTGCSDNNTINSTQVRNVTIGAISNTAITLIWEAPIDTVGYMGVTISEQDNSGSLSTPAEVATGITTYEVTDLKVDTKYTFTIATRYLDSSKNNNTTITVTTLSEATQVQSAASDATSATAITLNWDIPTDTVGFLGVTISEENNSGSLLSAVDIAAETTTYQVTGLKASNAYTFTIATRYVNSGKNNSTIVMGTTASVTAIQNAAIDASATTSDSVTITWDNPVDEENYTGVTITADPAVGSLSTEETVAAGTNTLTISDLTAETKYMLMLTFATEYDDTNKGSSSDHTIPVTTQSNRVTNVAINGINTTVLTLTWQNPEDTTDYTEVIITAEPAAGNIATPQTVPMATTAFAVTELTAGTTYRFTFATIYSDNKSGSSTDITVKTLTAASIDSDGDSLIDITSLERLHNMRYTRNGSRYRTSSTDPGSQCGSNGTTACTGYELTRSLDFTDADSYDGSIANAMRAWRPNSMANSMGRILPQTMADNGTNSGWNPIGIDGNPFNSRVEGNGHTIHNLYGRRSTAGQLGLFGSAGANSVIRSIGVATVRLYGSDGRDTIGALAGFSAGTIVASYASGTLNGGAGDDSVGGLVGGYNSNIIVANYASTTVNGGAGDDDVGGLVGENSTGTSIIVNYASGTVSGGANDDNVGGLLGRSQSISVIASYATATVNGGANNDNVGGLGGGFITSRIIASFANGTANGGADSDTTGSIAGIHGDITTATYGFGMPTGETAGIDGTTPRPAGIAAVGSGIAGARMLTLDTAGAQWNQVMITAFRDTTVTTMNAWDFGTAAQAPALRYADYDGTEGTYGCGDGSGADIVIPSVVATPTGPMTITCGTTLLPEQVR